jgi:hypothetical protein
MDSTLNNNIQPNESDDDDDKNTKFFSDIKDYNNNQNTNNNDNDSNENNTISKVNISHISKDIPYSEVMMNHGLYYKQYIRDPGIEGRKASRLFFQRSFKNWV